MVCKAMLTATIAGAGKLSLPAPERMRVLTADGSCTGWRMISAERKKIKDSPSTIQNLWLIIIKPRNPTLQVFIRIFVGLVYYKKLYHDMSIY